MSPKVVYSGQPRHKLLKTRYGITVTQWNKIFKYQNGRCPICLNPIYKPKNREHKQTACVEHDHKSKRVRGLTCAFCNRWRIARNSVETVRRLLPYMESDFDGRKL